MSILRNSLDVLLELFSPKNVQCLCHHQYVHAAVLHGRQASKDEHIVTVITVDAHQLQDICWDWSTRHLTQHVDCLLQGHASQYADQGSHWCWIWTGQRNERLDIRRMPRL